MSDAGKSGTFLPTVQSYDIYPISSIRGLQEMVIILQIRFYKASTTNHIFSIVTITDNAYRKYFVKVWLAYSPITRRDDVRLTWRNIVNGNCMLRSICE